MNLITSNLDPNYYCLVCERLYTEHTPKESEECARRNPDDQHSSYNQ